MPDRESNPIKSNTERVKHETHTIWRFAAILFIVKNSWGDLSSSFIIEARV